MRKRTRVILNPAAGDGHASQIEPEIEQHLAELGFEHSTVHTERPGHASELAVEAVAQGYELLIGVGGDGTSNEIVNGLLGIDGQRSPVAYGSIPAGSGNDFAAINGIPTQVADACQLIARQEVRKVDVARITVNDQPPRYGINTIGIGFDALVTIETKRRPNARGLALYLPAVLRTIFVTLQPMRVAVTLDDAPTHMTSLMLTVGNGAREGHAFVVAPNAVCDDGLLDVLLVGTVSRLGMLGLLPRFFNGSHVRHKQITEHRCQRFSVRSEDPMPVHVDGEVIATDAHQISVDIVQGALSMIKPNKSAL